MRNVANAGQLRNDLLALDPSVTRFFVYDSAFSRNFIHELAARKYNELLDDNSLWIYDAVNHTLRTPPQLGNDMVIETIEDAKKYYISSLYGHE